jgi:hypothetical protein
MGGWMPQRPPHPPPNLPLEGGGTCAFGGWLNIVANQEILYHQDTQGTKSHQERRGLLWFSLVQLGALGVLVVSRFQFDWLLAVVRKRAQ